MTIITTNLKSYQELLSFETFEERFEYLKLNGKVGEDTFGFDRYLNQKFYQTDAEWKSIRNKIIIRDDGCDLGIRVCEIPQGIPILIHHINPITVEDIKFRTARLLDPDNLISTIDHTHRAIHYGGAPQRYHFIERTPNDTAPWRNTTGRF